MDVKTWKATDPKLPSFPKTYKVVSVQDLSCTDIKGNNNKYYHLEIQVAGKQARVHSEYGRVGAKNPAREYRYVAGEADATKVFESIIKAKTQRKNEPYVKIDLAQRSIGSSSAKKIVKKVTGGTPVKAPAVKSKLEPEVQRLVNTFFKATSQFVETTLKCPLGQLSREQIDQGREVLDQAKTLVNAGQKLTKKSKGELEDLTSRFYSLIPHNFGFQRLDATKLLLSDLVRIAQKESDLDVFLDAKNAGNALTADIDAKYRSLHAKLTPIDKKDPTFKWLDTLVHKTRATNHKFLGKIVVRSIFEVARDGEGDFSRPSQFIENATKIAVECGKYNAPHVKKIADRPDLDAKTSKLFQKANVWPVWHGTRNANMTGIITRGLLIRPAGAVHAGSMFGDGLYFAHQSTKSLNYSSVKGSYWASGKDETGFLFVADTAFGNMHVADHSKFFRAPPKGFHSVYGKAGKTRGLLNDEMITYYPTGPKQQHALRYVLEIETKA